MADHVYPDEFQNFLPDDYLIAIGKVTVAWGNLETVADLVLNKLSDTDGLRCAVMTAHMSWPQKMDAIAALVDGLRPDYPHLERFDAVKPLLLKAQEGRNRVAHGQWGHQEGIVTKARATARGKLRARIDPITLADIDGIVRDIGHAAIRLWRVVVNR